MINQDIEITRTLLLYGASPNSTTTTIGRESCTDVKVIYEHPLVIAAELRNIPMVELLLSHGADPNGVTAHTTRDTISGISKVTASITALYCAVERTDVDMVKLLILRGAKTDCRGKYGDTVFHLVADCTSWRKWHKDPHSADFPSQHCDEQSEVLRLCLNSSSHTSKTLRLRNDAGYSTLHHAVSNGCTRNVQILLDAGADPNRGQSPLIMDIHGSPLHVAIYKGFYDIAQALLLSGSNLNLTNFWGYTPLLNNVLRCRSSDIMTDTLIVHGASLEIPSSQKLTLISRCIRNMKEDCEDTCRLLVYAGCSTKEESWLRPFDSEQSKVEVLCDWLRTRRNNPHRLKALSRIYIRTFLSEKVTKGCSIVGGVLKLPLPKIMHGYLLLKEIVDVDCHPHKAAVTQPGVVQG